VLTPAVIAVVARRWIDPHRVHRAIAWTLAGFAAYALCAVAVQGAITGVESGARTAGAAAVAWAAGLVVVIAPGGLGVREAVFVALMRGKLTAADAAATAVLMRVVTIAAETLAFGAIARPRTWRLSRIRTESVTGTTGRSGVS
jgi:uncharacterized membrane protein YbhN (UPF0104 family)